MYQSDARVAALTLTNLCLDEYQTFNRKVAQYNFYNSKER